MTSNEQERGELKIAGPHGERVIKDALLFNSLAVHKTVGGFNWTITHRATGCRIGSGDNEALLGLACRELERLHPDAFAELDKKKFGQVNVNRQSKALKALVADLEKMGLRS